VNPVTRPGTRPRPKTNAQLIDQSGAGDPPDYAQLAGSDLSPTATRLLQAWGSRPARLGPITVIFGALAGGLLTVLAGYEPGLLLGLFVIAATVVGALVVRHGASYLVIPVPAVAYFVVAVIAGLIHDRATDNTRTGLAANALQWLAGGFFYMCLATAIAIATGALRWLMTGRAAYRGATPWAARMAGRPIRTRPSHGSSRSGGITPTGRSRAGTTRTGPAQTGSGTSGRAERQQASPEPEGDPVEDTARIEPLPRRDGFDG
jgi:hypothetical protein